MLNFDDGVSIDTSGEPRLLHLPDGWYAVGEGMLIPCNTKVEAERWVYEMKLESKSLAGERRANQ